MPQEAFYKKSTKVYQEQLHGTKELLPRMATLVAALKESIPYYSGCGFYFAEQPDMEVGPYQGHIVCAKIGYHGICGKSIKTKQPVLIPDTTHYKERIICDKNTQSELALPVVDTEGRIIASFYAESPTKNAFTDYDIQELQRLLKKLFT